MKYLLVGHDPRIMKDEMMEDEQWTCYDNTRNYQVVNQTISIISSACPTFLSNQSQDAYMHFSASSLTSRP